MPPKQLKYHLEKPAQKHIQDLLDANIIRRVSEHTKFCSKAKFLQKPSGDVRLVINYIYLNKNIICRNKPFTGTNYIRKNLHNNSTCFWSADFISGYYQIPLNEDSHLMTTFTTPFGRFCFQTLPQGISDSMDGFNISTDYIVEDIP